MTRLLIFPVLFVCWAAAAVAAEPATSPGGGLYLIAMTVVGDEKPLFGEPLRIAGAGAEQVKFLADGSLSFRLRAEGQPQSWRYAEGKLHVLPPESAERADAAALPVVTAGKLLEAAPIPGTALWALLIEDSPEYPGQVGLFTVDPTSGDRRAIITAPNGSRVFAWDGQGRVWMADGTNLVRHCPACGGGWRRLLDLRRFGLGPIDALAIAPTGTALAVAVKAQ